MPVGGGGKRPENQRQLVPVFLRCAVATVVPCNLATLPTGCCMKPEQAPQTEIGPQLRGPGRIVQPLLSQNAIETPRCCFYYNTYGAHTG